MRPYTWDYRNRLKSASNGTATAFGYDHDSQRVAKKIGSAATTTYPNKYFNTQGGATTTTIVHILMPDGSPIATVQGTGAATTTAYTHADHLGSTNVMSNSTGNAIEVTDYYPYGAQNTRVGSFTEQEKYIGEQYDAETAFSYLNARYYSGDRGQFISQDPTFLAIGDPARMQSSIGVTQDFVIRDPQLMNSYSYARNNPITMKDPNGNIPAAAIPFILFGVGAALDAGATYYTDVMENRALGIEDVYTDNLSSGPEYGVGAIGGGISMSTMGVGRIAGGVVAGVNSLAQDWTGGKQLDYGKAAIVTGGTAITGTAFKGLVGASPFEKAATRKISQSAIVQGLRYETSQGVLQSGVNAIAVSNYQSRSSGAQNSKQNSAGGSLSSVLNSLSRALNSLSKILNSMKK